MVTAQAMKENPEVVAKITAKAKAQQIFRGTAVDAAGKSTSEVLYELNLDWKPATSAIRYGGIFENVTNAREVLYRPEDGMFMDIVPAGWHDTEESSFEGIVDMFKNFCDDAGIQLSQVGKNQRLMPMNKGQDCRLDLDLYAVADVTGAEEFELEGHDVVAGKLLLHYPYKYGSGIKTSLMAIRIACLNGMTRTVTQGSKVIQHGGQFSQQKILEALEGARGSWKKYQQEAELLAETAMPLEVAIAKVIEQFGDVTRPANDQPKVVQHILDTWQSGNYMGSELISSFKSAWGLLNVVTEYYNHNYGRSRTADTVVGRLIDSTSVVNRSQEQFMASLSSFAWQQAQKTQTFQTVGVRG